MRPWLLMLLAMLSGCDAPYRARFMPVDSDGQALRDESGRTVILRGVNARVSGVFDVTFSDGRAPREAIPGFDASDVAQLRASGFNLVRLPINWSGIEPVEGSFDENYLDGVQAVVDLLRGSGVYVLLDFHEDGYSKELCEDGAPLWAIDPPPQMLVGGPGPLQGSVDCHSSAAALQAFTSFFADANMLQEEYVKMATHVAQRFAGDAQVLGYEVMNEPIGEDDTIAAFDAKVAAAIRAVDPQHLVLFEPSATRNFTNSSPISGAPFAVPGAVYSVHVYTAVFGNNPTLAAGTYPPALESSIEGAREEATGWATPLVITEYGIGADSSEATDWIGHFLDDADAQLASTALWLWKEQSQGEWGLFQIQPDGSWTPRPSMFQAVSRPYPQAVGGDLDGFSWDRTTLTVAFHGHAGVPATHVIFWNGATPTIRCDGHTVSPTSVDAGASLYTVACGGSGAHTVTFQ